MRFLDRRRVKETRNPVSLRHLMAVLPIARLQYPRYCSFDVRLSPQAAHHKEFCACMEVKNAEYFHIHRLGQYTPMWQVGRRINWVQKRNNLFYDHFNEHGLYYDDGIEDLPFGQALDKFFASSIDYQRLEALSLLKAAREATKSQSLFIREEIFEEVRGNYFPHLPSRKTCIWVCTQEAVEFWWSTLNPGNQKLLKLNLTGSLFIADQRHLLADTYRHNDIRARAFEYWTGSDGIEVNDQEVLFEGIIDVVAEYNSPDEL